MATRVDGRGRLIGATSLLVLLPLAWVAVARRNPPAARAEVPARVVQFSEEIQRRSAVRRSIKEQATEFGRVGNWAAVVRTIDAAVEADNNSAGMHVLRAEALLRIGRFGDADRDLKRAAGVGLLRGVMGGGSIPQYGAISGRDDDPVPMAVLHLLGDDPRAFARYRQTVLERTDPADAPASVARNVAWAILLVDPSPSDIQQATRLAERAAARTENDDDGSYASALALARWRAGQTDDAVRILSEAATRETILPQALLSVVLMSRKPSPESAQANQAIDVIMTRTFGDLSADRVQAVLFLRERLRQQAGEPSDRVAEAASATIVDVNPNR
ncbi:MAG: hypothetical protein ACOVT5_06995 [Armatimonadaceae bacterium]|jgi:hypothetical protein